MPAKVTKKKSGKCSVKTPHGTKAKNTSCPKARRQARLLNAIDHGFEPTGKPFKKNVMQKY